MEREAPPKRRGEFAYGFLHNRLKTIDEPATRQELKRQLDGLTIYENTLLAAGLVELIAINRIRKKEYAALSLLELQLAKSDEDQSLNVYKIDGNQLALTVGEILDAFGAKAEIIRPRAAQGFLTKAVELIEPYVLNPQRYTYLIEKSRAANVFGEETQQSRDAIEENLKAKRFLDLLKKYPTRSSLSLALVCGLGALAARRYVKKFQTEGLLTRDEKPEEKTNTRKKITGGTIFEKRGE